MKLEVGMYIRTKDGLIAKIQSINEYAIALKNTYCERRENKYFTFPNEEEKHYIALELLGFYLKKEDDTK